MHKGAIGTPAATLQRLLQSAGFKIPADGWFGDATEAALIAFQRRAGLVADGIAGPKTLEALQTRARNPKHLSEQDLEKMRIAGRLAADVLQIVAPHDKPGVSTAELDRICHAIADVVKKEQG